MRLGSLMMTLMFVALAVGACVQSEAPRADGNPDGTDQDVRAIRALLADGFEDSWNNHHPATSASPDKCGDGAIFINTSGGWVKGCQEWAALIAPLHAPGGPFHDHTRRHDVEELRFIAPNVAIAVVKTFDIRRAGVLTAGEETRGLVVLTREGTQWKVTANQNARIQALPTGNR